MHFVDLYLLFVVKLFRSIGFGAKFASHSAVLGLDFVLNDSARLLLLGMVASGCKCNQISPLAFVDLRLYDFPSLTNAGMSLGPCRVGSVWSEGVP